MRNPLFLHMKILITGGSGFLGNSVINQLQISGYSSIKVVRSQEVDLIDQKSTQDLLKSYKPDCVIHLAASVGGIGANMANPGKFFYDNIMMGVNVIHSSMINSVKKFVMVGTVCSYPKFCPIPFVENDLWNGYPEETNAPYGIAKKSLYVMLKAYEQQYQFNSTVLIPCNLYGPNDNFDDNSSHVIPALIKKFWEAKRTDKNKVVCWGTGNATREFLYVNDAAEAIVKSLTITTSSNPINLGGGEEISIKNLAEKVGHCTGFLGNIEWDSSKPDGQPRRYLDISLSNKLLGWKPKTNFDQGLVETIEWYTKNNS